MSQEQTYFQKCVIEPIGDFVTKRKAEQPDIYFQGVVQDSFSKVQSNTWAGIESAFKGETEYCHASDYYHNLRSLRNAATFLGTAPPFGGSVYVQD